MSRENVELVRSAYAHPDPLLSDLIAADAEFDISAAYLDGPVLKGVEEMVRFRDTGPWGRSLLFEPERFFDVDDDRVLVYVRVTATGQGSGAPVETRNAHEFTFRDGRIVRIKVYDDRDAALRAVGLGPAS